jgi:pterin-4a-carbinolamine dehydratase
MPIDPKDVLTHLQAKDELKKLSGWELLEPFELPGFIEKTFKFSTYLIGVQFVNKVAQAAEAADHHPDILLTWCKVTVKLSTHDVAGLTKKDFTLAAEIDRIFNDQPVS